MLLLWAIGFVWVVCLVVCFVCFCYVGFCLFWFVQVEWLSVGVAVVFAAFLFFVQWFVAFSL